jgi:RNA polymerase sigma-70 factor (ECF subfamily)
MTNDLDSCWQRIKEGEEKALKELLTKVGPSLINFAFKLTNDSHLAEEAVHDVLLRMWHNRETIEIKWSVKTYLYQAVHNQSINEINKSKANKFSMSKPLTHEAWQIIEENYEVNSFLIEKIEAEDTEKAINQIILELPNQCREIFKLSRVENKSNDEIALLMNISVSTVKTQIFRALEKIKAGLKNQGYVF